MKLNYIFKLFKLPSPSPPPTPFISPYLLLSFPPPVLSTRRQTLFAFSRSYLYPYIPQPPTPANILPYMYTSSYTLPVLSQRFHSGGVESLALLGDKGSLSFNLCKMSRMSGLPAEYEAVEVVVVVVVGAGGGQESKGRIQATTRERMAVIIQVRTHFTRAEVFG